MLSCWLTRACLVGLAVVAGCGGGGSSRLQGKWHGQRSEGVAPTVATQANAFATAMQLEVKGDAITVTTSTSSQSGHYKVVKEDKTSVVITTDKDGPTEPQTFTFVDDKTLKWAVVSGQSIVFSRM
ncbi:MAG TPA: hypothetical protein VIF15_06555 [Polyangiaceae bacterium]|jgi:hypothetical protein